MKKRHIAVLLALVGVAGCAGFLYHQYRADFGPGGSMEETAHIIVHDSKFGMRAIRKAIQHGDKILPLIHTERSLAILSDLYTRTNAVARLTGAIGLAQHKALPDPVDENSFLVQNVRADPSQTETWLSIIALGWTKDEKSLPCLIDLLKQRPMDYWHHAHACEALARIGSELAIPVLRDCLKSEQFYALPSAFRALIALGDREAVPLAIARVAPENKGKNSGFVVRELEKVTGKSYGYRQSRWEKWWISVKDQWQIPGEFTKPRDTARCSCSATPRLVSVPCVEYRHGWKPEFWCEEHYAIGVGDEIAKVDISCTNREWTVSVAVGGRRYPRTKYAELYGPGGGGIRKLYQTDIDRDGRKDFVAFLYTGSSSGSDYGQVVFLLPEDDRLRILSHWAHGLSESRINEYYRSAQHQRAR